MVNSCTYVVIFILPSNFDWMYYVITHGWWAASVEVCLEHNFVWYGRFSNNLEEVLSTMTWCVMHKKAGLYM